MHLVKMERGTFEAFSDERLGWACMEPVFMLIRGKRPEIKAEIIGQLSRAQKALCMFRVFYDHGHKSAAEYYTWLSHMLDMPGYWDGVQEALSFFGDSEMMQLLQDTKNLLELRNNRLGRRWSEAAFKDLEQDAGLAGEITVYYDRFQSVSVKSLAAIAAYIRAYPEQFVELTA